MKIIATPNIIGLLLLGLVLLLAIIWVGLAINRYTRQSWEKRITAYNEFLQSVAINLNIEWQQPPVGQHPIIGQYSSFGKIQSQVDNFEISWSVISISGGEGGSDNWLQLDLKCKQGHQLVNKLVKKNDTVAAWPQETRQLFLSLASRARRLNIYPDRLEYVPNTRKTVNWMGESFILPEDKNLLIEVWQIALKLAQQLQAINH